MKISISSTHEREEGEKNVEHFRLLCMRLECGKTILILIRHDLLSWVQFVYVIRIWKWIK